MFHCLGLGCITALSFTHTQTLKTHTDTYITQNQLVDGAVRLFLPAAFHLVVLLFLWTKHYHEPPAALEADGSPASHPLTIARPIRTLSEIDNWFDSISYSKGAAVLRMLRAWVNRNKNDITGLVTDDNVPSAAAGGQGKEVDSHASTTQQWNPRLRLRRLQSADGSSDRSSDSSSDGSSDGSSNGSNGKRRGGGGGSSSSTALVPQLVSFQQKGSSGSSGRSSSKDSRRSVSHPWLGSKSHPFGGLLLDAAPPPPPAAAAAANNAANHGRSADPAAAAAGTPGVVGASKHKQHLMVLPIDAPVPPQHSSSSQDAQPGGSPTTARVLGVQVNPDQDKFVLGLRQYLRDHSYHNSNYSGLWQALGQASGEKVADIMSTWTLRRWVIKSVVVLCVWCAVIPWVLWCVHALCIVHVFVCLCGRVSGGSLVGNNGGCGGCVTQV